MTLVCGICGILALLALVAMRVGNLVLITNINRETEQELVDLTIEKNLVQEIIGVETSEDFEILLPKMKINHEMNTESYGRLVGNTLLGLRKRSEEERSLSDIRKFCKILQCSEYRMHDTQAEAHMCLKKMLSPFEYTVFSSHVTMTISARLMESYFSIMNRISQKCCPAKTKNENSPMKRFWIQTKRVVKVSALHLDLTKDCLILWLLLNIHGDTDILFDPNFVHLFQSQFVWAWLLSIAIPYVLSAVRIFSTNPFLCFGSRLEKKATFFTWEKTLVQILEATILMPLLMAMTLFAAEEEKEKMMKEAERFLEAQKINFPTERIQERINDMREYILKAKTEILMVRRAETIENSVQIILQGSMLMIYYSTTKTTRGLEAAFARDGNDFVSDQVFLITSIVFSSKKSVFNILKTKKEVFGDVLGFKSKIILGMRAFLTSVVRTICVLGFFTPYLGLCDIYQHLKVIIAQ